MFGLCFFFFYILKPPFALENKKEEAIGLGLRNVCLVTISFGLSWVIGPSWYQRKGNI